LPINKKREMMRKIFYPFFSFSISAFIKDSKISAIDLGCERSQFKQSGDSLKEHGTLLVFLCPFFI
jgi:hypothetical protein